MSHFMIVLILYINLLNISWIKMPIFEEYGAFNNVGGTGLVVKTIILRSFLAPN